MILPDVNILIYAHREDTEGHSRYRSWLEGVINGDGPFGLSDLVLSGFLRVVTHPRIFNPPTRLEGALSFVNELRSQPNCVPVMPGRHHWDIFSRICRQSNARGNLIADAYFAALAIESGCEWVTTDRDYGRFPGLKWRHPLDADFS